MPTINLKENRYQFMILAQVNLHIAMMVKSSQSFLWLGENQWLVLPLVQFCQCDQAVLTVHSFCLRARPNKLKV